MGHSSWPELILTNILTFVFEFSEKVAYDNMQLNRTEFYQFLHVIFYFCRDILTNKPMETVK